MQVILFSNIGQALPIYITGIGLDYPQAAMDRKNGFEDYQWLECTCGSGVLKIRKNEYVINESHGILLPKNETHSYHPTTDDWTVNWISFNGTGVPDFYRALNLEDFMVSTEKAASFLKRAASSESTLDSAVRNSAVMIEMLCHLARKGSHTAIAPAIAYMNSNYQKDITLEELASTADLSLQHFCKLFLKYTGSRPFSYLARLRIAKSKELLINQPSLPIEKIASLVGYHSYQYFIKVFKGIEGITPGEYRKLF